MNRDGYETAWTGPGESITGNGQHAYTTAEMTDAEHAAALQRILGKGWKVDQITGPAFPSELTPIGEQLVIPGCERRPVDNGKPAQLSLFG